jgi:hypothetical protein
MLELAIFGVTKLIGTFGFQFALLAIGHVT